MKVKIGKTWYSNDDTKIAIVFDEFELEEVKQMTPETHPNLRLITGRFWSDEEAKSWADEVEE